MALLCDSNKSQNSSGLFLDFPDPHSFLLMLGFLSRIQLHDAIMSVNPSTSLFVHFSYARVGAPEILSVFLLADTLGEET